MKLPLPDYNKKINKGDISFVYKGVYHPIQWFGDDPYRPRVETIVIKDGNQMYLRMYEKDDIHDYNYRLPGGSLDNDSTKIQQAENETNEEALLKVKNIYQSPVSYFENYPDGFLLKNGDICIAYKGTYTDVFVAEYKGKQDKSKIDEHDLDDDMANNGKFYYITNVCNELRPEHIDTILNCPFVNDSTKGAIRILMANKIKKSTLNSSIPVIEGKVPNPRKHHYNTYMMIELMDNEKPFGIQELSRNINDNIWLATDVHIGDPEDTWRNKRRRIIMTINRTVKKDDHLLFLGDMVGHGTEVTLDMLKGFIKALYCENIYLILGNNDYFTMEEYKSAGFKAVTDKFYYKNYIFTHCPIPDVDDGYLNIHGHIHGSKMYYDMDPDRHIDVWDDNYTPIKLRDIVKKYESGEYIGVRKDFNLMTPSTESVNSDIVPIFTICTRYNSAFGIATRAVTGSTYSHSALALNSDLSAMYSYVRNLSGLSEKDRKTGFDVETLDYYTKRDENAIMSVNAVFVNKNDFIDLKNKISKYLKSSSKTLYDYKNLFRVVFGISIDNENINDDKMICSEFVAKMLTITNVDLPKSANLMIPDDIENLSKTNSNVINVFTGRIKDYDKKKVDKVVKEVILTLTDNTIVIESSVIMNDFEFIDIKNPKVSRYMSDKYWKKYGQYHMKNSVGEIAINKTDDCLAGYIMVNNKVSGSEGFITPLYVVPKYRHMGLGTKLLEDGINKYGAIDLVVSNNNNVAIKIYKNHGFVPIGKGNGKNSTWMKLRSKLTKDDKIITESIVVETVNDSELSKITTPEKLSSWMRRNIKYWQHDNSDVETFDEILDSKKGDCYDQVEFEKVMFDRMNIRHSGLFMIEYKDSNWEQGYGTHSLLYYRKNNKFYWFENAWGLYQGIHQYDSLDDMKKDLHNKWEFKYGCDRLLITTLGNVHPGMSHDEYAYECTKKFNKKPTNGVYAKESIVVESNANITYSHSFKDVKKVVDSLSNDDLNRICGGKFKESPYVIYREVLLLNGVPVSFIEVYKLPSMKEDGIAVLATNPSYRNKGFASLLIHNMSTKLRGKNIVWRTQLDNEISIYLGKKSGYNPVTEISAFDSDSKVMANLNLSTLHKKVIDDYTLKPYIKDFSALQYIDTSDDAKGFIWFDDEENPVAYVNVLNDKENVYTIQQLQVLPKYKKCGLTSQLINVAIRELKANKVTVSTRNEELHKAYLNEGFEDINETQFSYTMVRGNIVSESVVTESIKDNITKVTLYHGSNKLFDIIEPVGLDFGNKFVEPGWSVFLFKKKRYAENWAVCQVLKNNIYRQYLIDSDDNLYSPGFDAKKYKCLLGQTTHDKIMGIINNLNEPLYAYLYEVEVDRKDVHIGNSSFIDEYTVRKSLVPKNITKIEVNAQSINMSCYIVPDDEVVQIKHDSMKARNQLFNRGVINSLLNTTEYAANGWIAKALHKDIANGSLTPGDDLTEYIQSKGYHLAHMYPIDRIYHYVKNTDVKDINRQHMKGDN